MKALRLFILLLLPVCAWAQKKELIPEAVKIKRQYDLLGHEKRAVLSHVDYITAFPDNKTTFLWVFYPYELDQLYTERHKYMQALRDISEPYPQKVIAKLVPIAKELKGNEDVVGELQVLLLELAANNTDAFVTEANKLKKTEQASLAAFLVHIDNEHKALPATLLQNLELADPKLARIFSKAISDKEKERDNE